MCFYIEYNNDKPKIAKIADKDIICYKTLGIRGNTLISAVKGFSYEMGKKYCKKRFPSRTIKNQLHGEGFHSYTSCRSAYNGCIVVECIIPKGTRYYSNKHEYCSEAIVINKVVKLNDVRNAINDAKREIARNIKWIERHKESLEEATKRIAFIESLKKSISKTSIKR